MKRDLWQMQMPFVRQLCTLSAASYCRAEKKILFSGEKGEKGENGEKWEKGEQMPFV